MQVVDFTGLMQVCHQAVGFIKLYEACENQCNLIIADLKVKPAAHESYRMSKSFSCLSAQLIAQRVRVDFAEFLASPNLFSRIKHVRYEGKGCTRNKT